MEDKVLPGFLLQLHILLKDKKGNIGFNESEYAVIFLELQIPEQIFT